MLLLVFCVALGTAVEQEKITLTTPEVKSNPDYRLDSFSSVFDNSATEVDEGLLQIGLVGGTGEMIFCRYTGMTKPTGTFLNTALQKANLSLAYTGNATTGSLKQRICHRLAVMGEALDVCGRAIIGTCTGAVP